MPTLISKTVAETASPTTLPRFENLKNGDFLITASAGIKTGDGIDETTIWVHDFREKGTAYQSFIDADPATVISAELFLTLIPTSNGISADTIRVMELGEKIGIRGYLPAGDDSLALDEPLDIRINLLDHYTPEQLLLPLKSERPSGCIFLLYHDDAIITASKLVIVY